MRIMWKVCSNLRSSTFTLMLCNFYYRKKMCQLKILLPITQLKWTGFHLLLKIVNFIVKCLEEDAYLMSSLAVLVYWMQPCMSAVMWMHQTETLTCEQYNNVLDQLTIKCIFYCPSHFLNSFPHFSCFHIIVLLV